MEVRGRRVSTRFVPLGRFWGDGVREFGADAWFADTYHGSRLAQHATAHLWFAFLLERNSRGLTFAKLPTQRRLDESDQGDGASAGVVKWLETRVWELFLDFPNQTNHRDRQKGRGATPKEARALRS